MDKAQLNNAGRPSDIAIVGMASHFPDAATLYDFWTNIVNRKDSIIDVDQMNGDEYWRKADFYDPDPTAPDKTYGHKAGFVPPIEFDPVEFKLPPLMLESVSTAQIFALYVAKQAMQDARLIGDNPIPTDKDRIGVILGGAGNGNTSFSLGSRQQSPYLKKVLVNTGLSEPVADEIISRANDLYLEWNEDSFPGFLGNVACGRIASYFDLGGTSYMVDAACASSLAAIKSAMGELADHSCDVVLTGGVNLENSVFSFLCFSKTPALSKSNISRPFDAESDGMMLGDGVGFLVLKRLADAERDGDRIYAVIKSLQASSDGRAKSIFAPRHEGQVKAMHRAYERAGVSPADIQLVEAHGTGTQSGDHTEIRSLRAVFEACQIPEGSIAIGSVKSQIGHTRCAAGAASMMKVALGLYHKVLPPTINVKQPSKELALEGSPFYVNTDSKPWFRPVSQAPRRAALSAFGFGGTNYHAILEEYQPEQRATYRLNRRPEVVLLQADSPDALLVQGQAMLTAWQGKEGLTAFRQHQLSSTGQAVPTSAARLAFAAEGLAQAIQLLGEALKQLSNKPDQDWEHPLGIYYKPFAKASMGRVVALFPGQGAQYVSMAREVVNDYPIVRQTIEMLDQVAHGQGLSPLSGVMFPPPAFSEATQNEQMQQITRTSRAQPAIGAISAGYFKLLQGMGLQPDFFAGHSYGEVAALWAAGALTDQDFVRVSLARGAAVEASSEGDMGAMLAAAMSEEQAETLLQQFPALIVANFNSPEQLVLGGASAVVQQALAFLNERKIRAQMLPVAAAFHTPFVEHACVPFQADLADIAFQTPQGKVYSTATAETHDSNPAAIKQALVKQLISPVRFTQTIEQIHAAGGDLFVEIGPKGILGKLVGDILKGKPHSVVSVNPAANGDASLQFKRALAKLLVEGVALQDLDPQAEPIPLPPVAKQTRTYTMTGGFFLSDKSRQRRERALRKDSQVVEAFIQSRLPASAPALAPAPAPASTAPVLEAEPVDWPAPRLEPELLVGTLVEDDTGMNWLRAVPALNGEGMMQSGNQENEMLSVLGAQIQAQNVLSQVHQQFQINQREYIQLLNSLLGKQCALLEKFQGSPQLTEVVSSLSQSFQLLDKNQELYHVNHEHYFDNQHAMLGGDAARQNRIGVATSQRAPISLPASPAVAPVVAPVSAPAMQPAVATAPVQAPKPVVPALQPATPAPAMAAPVAVATPAPAATKLSPEDEALVKRFEAITVDELISQLIEIVSDRTGYPADMITAEMDLEADLGIDSIKRLEIFGAMFDILATDVPYFQDAESTKESETFDIDAFSNIRKMAVFFKDTIDELLAEIKGQGASSEAAATVETAEAAPVVNTPAAAAELPAIVETPIEAAPPIRNLGVVTTTRKLADQAGDKESAAKKSLAEPREDASAPARRLIASDADTVSQPVQRFQPVKRLLPKPDQRDLALPAGQVWLITDDGKGLSDELAQQLLAREQKVVRLALAWQPSKGNRKGIQGVVDYALEQADEGSLQTVLSRITETEGVIGGVIHLQAAGQVSKSVLSAFQAADYDQARFAFNLAKAMQPRFSEQTIGRSFFFLISQVDGELGTAGRGNYPLVTAGVTGLSKSLNIEWEQTFCRTVDLDPKANKALAASMIVEELSDACTDVAEIGRGAKGERIGLGFEAVSIDAEAALTDIDDKSVFVVTGGARGITAECVIALAKRYPARFALLGRTRIDGAVPAWAEGISEVNALKASAIKHLQQQGEQPTPVKVDRMLKDVLQLAEVRQTLTRIEAAGGQARYIACDIADGKDVARAMADVQRELGPVTGLIHGAGNLADKRIEKKTAADFDSVFLTKVKGLETLLAAIKVDKLKHVVVFSSVSGFFGNAGQTDYAMANEVLSKFAWLFQTQYPKAYVRAINWGPWDTGMVNDVLKKAYAERNLAIIPTDIGVGHFVNEFRHAAVPQLLIGGGSYKVSPKIKQLPELTEINRIIKAEDNPFLNDHVVDGHAVLPATLAIGWMVQLGEDVLPGYHFEKLVDFRVLKGVVFDEAEQGQLRAEIRPLAGPEKGNDRHTLSIRIVSDQPTGVLQRYQGTLVMSHEKVAQPVFTGANLAGQVEVQTLYGDMRQGALLFSGPIFRGVQRILNVDAAHLTLAAQLPEVTATQQGQFPICSFNPYLGDVCVQPPMAWLLLQTDKAGLPSQITQWEQFATPAAGQPFYLSLSVLSQTQAGLVTDIVVHDEAGRVFSKLSGLTFTVSKKLRQLLCDPEDSTIS
ncbi:acyl transferase domain-containing protein/NADP-dependent 3-hydroxy acid dehydrogenase YdfG [Chitinivorax tropicus]|uniref:Acyl transferase domain-containing protein/NADP-dependent 3-hydroxy acid dehydrogenase YdfG n=1 Tax=Chitinivorax tropicus TaxID=714531 RepID=A0A840MHT7_9PROT|nr:type I polyketide synthase [Chitinivorax tropicus]MBB5016759.1 acyl transferase domain-containing protein/NADP-dependent 3-hydroxy acid dehydrogenase YdfG [Chitinivorax tropicus]